MILKLYRVYMEKIKMNVIPVHKIHSQICGVARGAANSPMKGVENNYSIVVDSRG